MNNCSELYCNLLATQSLTIRALKQKLCDFHYKTKKNTLINASISKNLKISKAICEFNQIIRETSNRILNESAMTIKAVQIKTQSDLRLLSGLQEEVKGIIALSEIERIVICEKFLNGLQQDCHFLNHFQEMGKMMKRFEDKIKIDFRTSDDMNASTVSLNKITIPRIANEELAHSRTIGPDMRPKHGRYKIETKNGLKTIPDNVSIQIDRALQQRQLWVNIFNGERTSNYIDLVSWKSYKIHPDGSKESYYYKIIPQ